MDVPQPLINWALSIVSGVVGWLLRELWEAHKSLAVEVAAMQLDVAKHYTPNDRFDATVGALFAKLDRIEELLRNKADK